jgi:hypothetical protein
MDPEAMWICTILHVTSSLLKVAATPLIAALGAWIALKQVEIAKQQAQTAASQAKIAHNKLEHEIFEKLYDRRVAVFEATRDFLARVYDEKKGSITEDEVKAYGIKTLDAKFLFSNELYKYLRDVHFNVGAFAFEIECEKNENSIPVKMMHRRKANEHLLWINEQGDENTGFAAKFEAYLIYKPTV